MLLGKGVGGSDDALLSLFKFLDGRSDGIETVGSSDELVQSNDHFILPQRLQKLVLLLDVLVDERHIAAHLGHGLGKDFRILGKRSLEHIRTVTESGLEFVNNSPEGWLELADSAAQTVQRRRYIGSQGRNNLHLDELKELILLGINLLLDMARVDVADGHQKETNQGGNHRHDDSANQFLDHLVRDTAVPLSETGVETLQADVHAKEGSHQTKVSREGDLRCGELKERINLTFSFILDYRIFNGTAGFGNVIVYLVHQILGILGALRLCNQRQVVFILLNLPFL